MAARHSRSWLCVLTFWLVACWGCSEATRPLGVAVHGTVQAGLQTHAAGWVTFAPAGNQNGSRVTAQVVAGKYRFESSNGPSPGSYEVLVGLTQDAAAAKERLLAEFQKSEPLDKEADLGTDEADLQLHEFRVFVPDAETHEQNFVIE